MNDEMKQSYLKDPTKCPYCQSMQLEAQEQLPSIFEVEQTVTCYGCGKKWNDVFKLADVKPLN